jgi:hypothetical protein
MFWRGLKMKSEYEKLKSEFEFKIFTLQEFCKHENTKWYEYMPYPGHFDGKKKICLRCNKTLKHNSPLQKALEKVRKDAIKNR